MSGTPKLTRLLPPSAMRRPLKENSTQAPKADCPPERRAPGAHFFRASRFSGGSFQLGKYKKCFQSVGNKEIYNQKFFQKQNVYNNVNFKKLE